MPDVSAIIATGWAVIGVGLGNVVCYSLREPVWSYSVQTSVVVEVSNERRLLKFF